MSPFSAPVLGGAALVVSPAIWDFAVEQSLPLDQALTRYLVAVGICWVLLTVLEELVLRPNAPAPADEADATATLEPTPGDLQT